MIDHKQIRIGNKLAVGTTEGKINIWTVNSIISVKDYPHFELYFDENEEYNHAWNAEYIPLTEEWLLKFGFEKHWMSFNPKKKDVKFFIFHFGGDETQYYYNTPNDDPQTRIAVKYVHQLQNLYVDLTVEELTIK